MLKTNINSKSRQGFTIIEVVLVLAIAGLIFLMVFLALPALQRSQKNTQRKNDISRLTAALSEYQSNNRNAVPTNMSSLTSYLGGENGFSGPNNTYSFVGGGECTTGTSAACKSATLSSGDDRIVWYTNAICKSAASNSTDAKEAVQPASTSTAMKRKVAFVVKMDGSSTSDGSLYCVNN